MKVPVYTGSHADAGEVGGTSVTFRELTAHRGQTAPPQDKATEAADLPPGGDWGTGERKDPKVF